MIIYEFKESVLNEAMDKLEEAKSGIKMSKKALCYIEDLLYELYEEGEHEEPIESENESGDEYEAIVKDNDIDINYRNRYGMRNAMRMRSGMRSGMRGGMRMRRSGRYNY